MVFDDSAEPKEIKDLRGIPSGSNLFMWRSSDSKKLTREKAEEDLFTIDLVVSLLNSDKYRKGDHILRHQLQNRKQIIKMGVESSDIRKNKDRGIKRTYITEQGVLSVLENYHKKGRINDYKEDDVLKDLKDLVIRF
nr:hypothetical protein [Nanoarchaeota archaeon]